MHAVAYCKTCSNPIIPDAFGYCRLNQGRCEGCTAKSQKRPTRAAEAHLQKPPKNRDHKRDFGDQSYLLLDPYLAELEALLDGAQWSRLRHALINLELDLTGHDYISRDYNLDIMGYTSYRDYLRSDLYWTIKDVVFEEKWQCCVACGWVDPTGNSLHHRRYNLIELMGLDIALLDPICHRCHRHIELHCTGKRSLAMANQHLNWLIKTKGLPKLRGS